MQFTIFYLIFVGLSFIYELKAESNIKRRETKGKVLHPWSYYLMATTYALLFLGSVAEYFICKRNINPIVTSLGATMYILGHLLRNWSVKTLRKFWSLHIKIEEDHKLVKEGPYRYARHPNYLATLLKGFGFALVPNSYYMLLYLLGIFLPTRLIRIYLEEKELIGKFGREYLDYKKKVYGLLPLKKYKQEVATDDL